MERERKIVSCLSNDMCALSEIMSQISTGNTIWYGVPASDVPLCVGDEIPGAEAGMDMQADAP